MLTSVSKRHLPITTRRAQTADCATATTSLCQSKVVFQHCVIYSFQEIRQIVYSFLCAHNFEFLGIIFEINQISTIMASFVKVILLLASLVTFCYTFYVVGKLTLFLSKPRSISRAHIWVFNLLDNVSRVETAFGPLVFDTIYLITFIFQHSFFKSAIVKNLLRKLHLAPAERTIYTLTSSLCLHVCIRHIHRNSLEFLYT